VSINELVAFIKLLHLFKQIQEAQKLIEQGSEYVTEVNGVTLSQACHAVTNHELAIMYIMLRYNNTLI
jgi:hypothetical protein